MNWETVVGLEIHAQLATASKIFSSAPTAYGAAPNAQANLVDLGYPGVLPVLNRNAVRMAVKFGLAVGASISPRSVFARKNYFYPDLPKGYQISQYERPVVEKGTLSIVLDDGSRKTIGITRAHLEEDAGKSLHEDFHGLTGIDLNRAGTPLLEIVSEPDMRSAKEAVAYMKKVHTLVRYLEICDGNMQEGSFRCDANVSVRPLGQEKYGTRCEIKNLNSFRFIEKAINYEVARQIELIEGGGKVKQETRLYDPDKGETRPLRSKEEANDYRYFPDPDLLPVALDDTFIESVRVTLPELPDQKAARYVEKFALSAYDAGVLTASREMGDYYEAVVARLGGHEKLAANWTMGELSAALNKDGLEITESRIDAAKLAGLLTRIADETISGKIAKEVFEQMWSDGGDADSIIEAKGLKQITDSSAIERTIDEVMAANPKQLADYRSGKDKLFGFFVGQVMKVTGGKANPAQVNELLKKKLAAEAGARLVGARGVDRVLFVCTGNIFRSLTAEFALRRALGAGSVVEVSSAGTEDYPHVVRPVVRDYLRSCGLDVSAHRRRTLTEELLERATLVVAMNHDHQRFIREYHAREVPLYTEACGQSAESLPDVDDVIPDYEKHPEAVAAHVRATIDKIIRLAPGLARTLTR